MGLITGLGYLEVGASTADAWAVYGTALVGLELADRDAGRLAFRMDERAQRIVVRPDAAAGIRVFGWDVREAASLDALAARLEANGVSVERGSRSRAAQRNVKDLIEFEDPLGNHLEAAYGHAIAPTPFAAGRAVSGFRTGSLGLGHVVLTVDRVDAALAFYRDVLEFRLSDYYHHPFSGYFFHVNERHHSFALIQTGKAGVHHLMLEHFDLDDVGQGYDLASQEAGRVAVTLGRHCGDYMTSYYSRTPSGFLIEHGWGGRLIDPATWVADVRNEGPSLWGHDRDWLPAEARANALKLRLRNAHDGLRRPVQVMAGNHELMPGKHPGR